MMLELIVEKVPNPQSEDWEIIKSILFTNEQAFVNNISIAEVFQRQAGIPFKMANALAKNDIDHLESTWMKPVADDVRSDDPNVDNMIKFSGAYVQGFGRGLTLARGIDIEDVMDDKQTMQEFMEAVYGGVDTFAVDFAAKVTAIRMAFLVDDCPEEGSYFPMLSQWCDGFLCGWNFPTLKTLRSMNLQ